MQIYKNITQYITEEIGLNFIFKGYEPITCLGGAHK